MKIPKSLQVGAASLDPAPPEAGVEVHLTLHPLEGPPRRFAGVFASGPRLDEVVEMDGVPGIYRVVEVRRSLQSLTELKVGADGSLEEAYANLAKRGVPNADEIVFVLAEEEVEETIAPDEDASKEG